MQQKLMKKTTVLVCLFSVIALGLIIGLSTTKVVTITEVAQDEVVRTGDEIDPQASSADPENALAFDTETATDYLCIPLPEGSKAEEITIENHYMDQELYVLIQNVQESFYAEHALMGNRTGVEAGFYHETEDGVALVFELTQVYEYRTVFENNELYISFLNPREIYNRIVVIDPSCGGLDRGEEGNGVIEKELTLQIAKKLKEKLDESKIKAYYTRMDDVNPDAEQRVELANEVKADMYIEISVDSREEEAVYGVSTVYNDQYFIPGFGSVELADLLERELASEIKTKALGLEKASEESKLRYATVPAAEVRVGCLSNKQEAILLKREDYIEKIANGIYNAIISSYETYF
ncbi:MAG: N-acetylmuramoyl-L-alanine amidase [Lachnospiraceae bacterium]|jgi:N-acetylmuramoyl-L-alanine amidase|nr:N-acetylmuramoyl-L-alanine amidase [Lachnospiraceae bacterium]